MELFTSMNLGDFSEICSGVIVLCGLNLWWLFVLFYFVCRKLPLSEALWLTISRFGTVCLMIFAETAWFWQSTVLDYDEDDNATSPTISVLASCCVWLIICLSIIFVIFPFWCSADKCEVYLRQESSREKNASGGFGFSTEEPGIYTACFAEDGGNRDGEESSSHDINSLGILVYIKTNNNKNKEQ